MMKGCNMLDRLLEELKDYRVVIHREENEGFDEDAFTLEVLNDSDQEEDHLLITYNGFSYEVIFGGNSLHYQAGYEEDLYFMLKEISQILENRKCSVSLYYNTDDFPKLMAGGFLNRKDVEGKTMEEIFRYVFANPELKNKIEVNGGKAVFRYFDPSGNRSVEIEKRKKEDLH